MLVDAIVQDNNTKPRVISEIRKTNNNNSTSTSTRLQRTPLLGHHRISGILNYYSDDLGIWTQRTVAVRDGCLLVFEPDSSPWDCAPGLGGTPGSYASLGRSRRPLPIHDNGPTSLDFIPSHSRIEKACSFQDVYFASTPKGNLSGYNSLGRSVGSCGRDGAEFKLPLRHLNLRPSNMAHRAFFLSYFQTGDEATAIAIFQALTQLEYERWVKTLAIEIIRQTPLEAIRFLDVLGIAEMKTPENASEKTETKSENKSSLKAKESRRKSSHEVVSRWDRSPSSEGSTTSADFISRDDGDNTITRHKRSTLGHSLPRRKLNMSDVESQSDKDEVDCVKLTEKTEIKHSSANRKSRDKIRRSRDNGSSSEETRAPDEGIVLEERGSSSDRSCRRNLWPSDRSDCLDSPRSVSSYSSYEYGDSPDTVDSTDGSPLKSNFSRITEEIIKAPLKNSISLEPAMERVYCKNTNTASHQSNNIKKKCDRRASLDKTTAAAEKKVNNSLKSNEIDITKVPLYRAKPFVNDVEYISLNFEKATPAILVSEVKPKFNSSKTWNRARSCSPNNETGRPSPRFLSNSRETRALSVGIDLESSSDVEALKQHCQDPENFATVREKLALFETLCRAGRLARSSEELAAATEKGLGGPRARSLHDLTRSRSPQVPVREMCKFFERCNNKSIRIQKKKSSTQTHTQKPTVQKTQTVAEKPRIEDLPVINVSEMKRNTAPKNKIDAPMLNKQFVGVKNSCVIDNFGQNIIQSANKDFIKDQDICETYNYACFKQIRQGNKIITYV